MSAINPYCTAEEVQAEIRNIEPDVAALLDDAIEAASRWIDRYKGRDYYQHDFTATPLTILAHMRYVSFDTLFLPFRPVITLTAVTVAGVAWTEGEHYVVGRDDDYGIVKLISLEGYWPDTNVPADSISLTGKFGYAQATTADVPTGLPQHIRRACVLAAAAFTGRNQKESVGLDGAKVALIDKNIPKGVYDLLGPRKAYVG